MSGRHRKGRRFLPVALTAAAAVLATTLAACQSDGASVVTPASAIPSASAAPTTPVTPSRAPLRAADFALDAGPETSRYSMEPDPDQGENSILGGPVADCLHLTQADLGPVATDHANGPVFTDDEVGTNIRSFASVFASVDTVAAHRGLVRDDLFPGCWGKALVDETDSDDFAATLTHTQTATPPPGATDRIQIELDTYSDGQEIMMYCDMVIIFTGRVETAIFVVNPFEPIDEATLTSLTSQVEHKVAQQ
ncbi:hypothetical protein [Pseudofrankia sp. EUN1h]|uniref:hypothetical protein n=2 Tax=Pseudofrankia TaxID=2994363 RepID=UPI000234D34A|nr:hypothetical protein [Pseudofrankia sp. EUN1h]OHV39837.1 hypothetical protein BCD49_09515 [Pseudofrankia sp. EUN1h]